MHIEPDPGLKKVGSIVIPFPDADVRLVDLDEGREDVKQGEPGEIIMRGPCCHDGVQEQAGRDCRTAEGRLAVHGRT